MGAEKITRETHGNFDEFWPDYVKAHQSSLNLFMHGMATTYEIVFVLLGFVYSFWLWALLPLGYLFAWAGHYWFEHNTPLTFTRVRWSWQAEHIMFFYLITGRWTQETDRVKAQGR